MSAYFDILLEHWKKGDMEQYEKDFQKFRNFPGALTPDEIKKLEQLLPKPDPPKLSLKERAGLRKMKEAARANPSGPEAKLLEQFGISF